MNLNFFSKAFDDRGNYKSILEFEIVSPRRIAAAASKLLKYHSVSTESQ